MKEKKITPVRAIRLKCLDCCCGNPYEVKLCPVEHCALYPYRHGKNPNRAGITNSGQFGTRNNGSTDDLQENELSEG